MQTERAIVSAARPAFPDRSGVRQRRDVSCDDQPRVCVRLRIQGSDQARRRSEGRLRPDPRRRTCRHDGGAGVAQGRIQGVRFWSSTAGQGAATGRCAAGIPLPNSAASAQTCEFEQGLYINPGPWRIPYHHRALLDYCKRLGVALEPFIQLNHNALLHATQGVRRRSAAHSRHQDGFPGPDFRIARQGDPAGQARRGGVEGGSRDPDAGAAVLGRARQQLRLQGQPDFR